MRYRTLALLQYQSSNAFHMLTTEQIHLPVNARTTYQIINKATWYRLFTLGQNLNSLFLPLNMTIQMTQQQHCNFPLKSARRLSTLQSVSSILIPILRPPPWGQTHHTESSQSPVAPPGWRSQGTGLCCGTKTSAVPHGNPWNYLFVFQIPKDGATRLHPAHPFDGSQKVFSTSHRFLLGGLLTFTSFEEPTPASS